MAECAERERSLETAAPSKRLKAPSASGFRRRASFAGASWELVLLLRNTWWWFPADTVQSRRSQRLAALKSHILADYYRFVLYEHMASPRTPLLTVDLIIELLDR